MIEAENKSLSLSTQITSAVSPGHSASAARRQTDPPVLSAVIMERLKKSPGHIKAQENITRRKSWETYILFLKESAIEVADKVKKTSTPTVREVTDELQ